jgi:peroxiredoxin
MNTTKQRGLALALTLALASAWAPVAQAVGDGTVAPEIALKDLAGHEVKLAALKGKVVLVDFWASWCGPCRDELPVLDGLYKKYKDKGLVIVGVGLDRDADKLRKFLRALPLSFPVVHDPSGAVASKYEPPKMPSSYMIDKRGLIRHVHAGFKASDKALLEKQLSALLGEK